MRVVTGDKTGYAHTDDIEPGRLLEAANAARRAGSDEAAGVEEAGEGGGCG